VNFAADVVAWLLDPVHWAGTDGIPVRLWEHLQISALSVLIAVLLALPVGLCLGHTGRAGFLAINVANVGRALPSLTLLALALPVAFALGLGLGFWPTLFAMIPLAIPPILTNAYVAMREVDRDVIEAARGMGMSEWQVVWSVEWPLALPLILAGIRTASVAVVATATLGAIVAGGGLGRYIVDGLARQEYTRLFVGALLVALFAVAVELAFAALQRATTPPTQQA
jgi:osmoprotectant transport system permease protein